MVWYCVCACACACACACVCLKEKLDWEMNIFWGKR